MKTILAAILCCGVCVMSASAQFRSTNDWMTENADAQRTATVRTDPVINKDFVAQPGNLKFLWKLKLKNQPNQLNNLSSPATLELLIGYRGFRMLGFVAGSGDNLFTIDTDLGRMEWERKLKAGAPTGPAVAPATLACPGGMTTSVVRPTVSAISAPRGGGFGGGRSTPAVSTVGEPGAGATTLSEVRGPGFSPPPSAPASEKPGPKTPPMGGVFGGGANVIYALASDGLMHAMHLSNGADFHPPVRFLPAGANAHGLIIVDGMAYAVTTNGCGAVPNGVWSLDFNTQIVSTWQGNVAGSAGAAFGPDGTIYVATNEAGVMSRAMSIVAIDAKTLQTKSVYQASRIFASTPVVFHHQGKTLIAAAAIDGAIHLLDAANLTTALSVSPATVKGAAPGSLASYVDAGGTRWILVAHTGALPAGFSGAATQGAILAYKIGEDGKLIAGWASRNLVAPLTPTVINGVVFATSSGEFKTQDSKVTAARSGRAVLYALDGATGKEVWSSGTTITSFARGNALSGGAGQLYLTTYDGTIYAFGHSIEH